MIKTDAPRLGALGAGTEDTIFVSIAAYRDPELLRPSKIAWIRPDGYRVTALAAGLVGLVFALFATSAGGFPFASLLQTPVASANSPSPSLTLVGKHIKVTGGVVPIILKAGSTFKGTVKLVSPASPGATKSILYSKAVTVKLAAHAKKTVKLTLDSAGAKYLAANSHLAIMSLIATPKGGAPFPVDVVFLSS